MAAKGGAAAAGLGEPAEAPVSLATLIQRKMQIEEDLASVEQSIFALEEVYLDETSHYGNIVKGWEGLLNARPKAVHAHVRKPKINDKDRVWSNSSTSRPLPDESEDAEAEGVRRSGRARRGTDDYDDDESDLDMD